MKKRRLLIGAISACLISALATGTLAYFTASDTATNTFKTAQFDPGDPDAPDELFGIEITERNPEYDPDAPTDPEDPDYDPDKIPERVPDGVTYEDILPQSTYTKDPQVTNTGAYDAYVRVKVEFDKVDVWRNTASYDNGVAYTDAQLLAMLLDQDTTNWTLESQTPAASADGTKVTFTFLYNKTLAKGATTEAVFGKVQIPSDLDKTQLTALNGNDGFHITVYGEAIQAENTNGDAEAGTLAAARNAFTLYDAQMTAAASTPETP